MGAAEWHVFRPLRWVQECSSSSMLYLRQGRIQVCGFFGRADDGLKASTNKSLKQNRTKIKKERVLWHPSILIKRFRVIFHILRTERAIHSRLAFRDRYPGQRVSFRELPSRAEFAEKQKFPSPSSHCVTPRYGLPLPANLFLFSLSVLL